MKKLWDDLLSSYCTKSSKSDGNLASPSKINIAHLYPFNIMTIVHISHNINPGRVFAQSYHMILDSICKLIEVYTFAHYTFAKSLKSIHLLNIHLLTIHLQSH